MKNEKNVRHKVKLRARTERATFNLNLCALFTHVEILRKKEKNTEPESPFAFRMNLFFLLLFLFNEARSYLRTRAPKHHSRSGDAIRNRLQCKLRMIYLPLRIKNVRKRSSMNGCWSVLSRPHETKSNDSNYADQIAWIYGKMWNTIQYEWWIRIRIICPFVHVHAKKMTWHLNVENDMHTCTTSSGCHPLCRSWKIRTKLKFLFHFQNWTHGRLLLNFFPYGLICISCNRMPYAVDESIPEQRLVIHI